MLRELTLLTAGIALAATLCPAPAPAAAGVETGAPETRHFELTYTAVVEDVPQDAGSVRIWLPYPTDDEAQEVEVTGVSSPYPTRVETEPEYGNSILYVEVDEPDGEPIPIEIRARVQRSEKLRKDFDRAGTRAGAEDLPQEVARWLEPDALVPIDDRIREIAAEATEGAETDVEKAKAIYDHVIQTMRYDKSGEGWGRGDIYWACDAKRGNCTDFHALFIGLNRAVGIPAKFAIGFPIPPDRGQGEIGGYHCWAEFWLDGYGWVPVDTSEAWKDPDRRDYFFGAHDENRVEFTEGRDLVLSPRQAGDPLNFFVYPYAEVDGEPWGAISQSFRYRDVAPEEAARSTAAGSGR